MTKAARSSSPGQVYLLGSPGSHIAKIGYSGTPEKRLWFLQVGSPVEYSILAKFDGSQELEAALHHYFRACHVRGEWFDLGDDPVEAVRTAVALGVTGLLSETESKEVPRATRSNLSCTALGMPAYRSMKGLDVEARFPPLPHWRAKSVLKRTAFQRVQLR
ncbi:GIY-YIG nuclease family protein [Streptomyces sp. NRAIS4]